MFEVNKSYANRNGTYTVLAIEPPRMTVRYEDGTTVELNMAIQERIWENILSEEEVKAASRTARRKAADHDFYIKSLSLIQEEDLSIPGWRERVTVVDSKGPDLQLGDRIIYYGVEDQVFFALATVTGPSSESVPKGFFYSDEEAENLRFYPIDVDEHVYSLDKALDLDAVELESIPNYRKVLQKPNIYIKVSEDDFELLAELLTEVTEEEDEEFEDEEEEEEFEE